MTRTVDLPPGDLAILLNVLRTHLPPGTSIWVFGSRATGAARRYSDLDLALLGDQRLDLDMLGQLKEELSQSDLTIKVDLVDLQAIDPAFRRMIEGDMVPLPTQTRVV
jgi:uncharacterized protein